jgi:hypothetical protein
LPTILFSQVNSSEEASKKNLVDKLSGPKVAATKVATMDQYRFISIERDTTYLDTSLTIQRVYSFNYLRKDNFGLLAFSNEGQTYNTL